MIMVTTTGMAEGSRSKPPHTNSVVARWEGGEPLGTAARRVQEPVVGKLLDEPVRFHAAHRGQAGELARRLRSGAARGQVDPRELLGDPVLGEKLS